MEGALRVISVERGHDPADFSLVPFGGAAGLHAVGLADRLGVPRLLVPPDPGVLSAFGMLVSPVRKDVSRSVLLTPGDGDRIDAVFADLEARARGAMEAEGVDPRQVRIRRLADARYAGQSFELTVPARDWATAFHEAHRSRYGFARTEAPVELVTARVEALGPATPTPPPAPRASPTASGPSEGRIPVRFQGRSVDARAVPRPALPTGATMEGPAVIHEYSATFWLPPRWRAEVLESGSLAVDRVPAV
jgi:N-methylhydantoinase A